MSGIARSIRRAHARLTGAKVAKRTLDCHPTKKRTAGRLQFRAPAKPLQAANLTIHFLYAGMTL